MKEIIGHLRYKYFVIYYLMEKKKPTILLKNQIRAIIFPVKNMNSLTSESEDRHEWIWVVGTILVIIDINLYQVDKPI